MIRNTGHDTDMNKYRQSQEFSSILFHFGEDYANTYDFVVKIARKEGRRRRDTLSSVSDRIYERAENRAEAASYNRISTHYMRYCRLQIMTEYDLDRRGYVVSLRAAVRCTVKHC